MKDSVRQLVALAKTDDPLYQFEGAMALTTVATLDDETKHLVVATDGGLDLFEKLQMSDHVMVRRVSRDGVNFAVRLCCQVGSLTRDSALAQASTEAMVNLVPCIEVSNAMNSFLCNVAVCPCSLTREHHLQGVRDAETPRRSDTLSLGCACQPRRRLRDSPCCCGGPRRRCCFVFGWVRTVGVMFGIVLWCALQAMLAMVSDDDDICTLLEKRELLADVVSMLSEWHEPEMQVCVFESKPGPVAMCCRPEVILR